MDPGKPAASSSELPQNPFFCHPERRAGSPVIKNTRFFTLYENSYQQSAFSKDHELAQTTQM
jgi:hypothetical protein